MTKKRIFWVVVIIVILLVSLKSCFNIEITKKLTAKDVAVKVLENLGILNAKVDQLAADVDTIKVDVRELKNRKGSTTIWRTKTVVVPQTGQPSGEPVYYNRATEQPQQTSRSEIIPGTMSGPDQFKFCIDLELNKSNDQEKKFLFWELAENRGYSIPNLVSNGKGLGNMVLRPGESVDGIAYDGSVLRISKTSMANWYQIIFSVPMPANFVPGVRSDLSGWGYTSRPMQSSGNYFVYRF